MVARPRAGRARSSAGVPRAAARSAGTLRRALEAHRARRAASARRALSARSIGGGFQVCRRRERRVDVVDVELAATRRRGRARAGRGAAARGRRRAASARVKRGPGAVAGTSVPSQKRDAERTLGERLRERAAQGSGLREGQRATWRSRPAACVCWRAGSIRTTSHARPTLSSPRMTEADGSISYQRMPWAAEVGKAWWLLCHASPNGQQRQPRQVARLVAGVEAPAPEEVAQRVDAVGRRGAGRASAPRRPTAGR